MESDEVVELLVDKLHELATLVRDAHHHIDYALNLSLHSKYDKALYSATVNLAGAHERCKVTAHEVEKMQELKQKIREVEALEKTLEECDKDIKAANACLEMDVSDEVHQMFRELLSRKEKARDSAIEQLGGRTVHSLRDELDTTCGRLRAMKVV